MDTKELLRTLATNIHLLLVSLALAGMTFVTITDPAASQARSSPDKNSQKIHSAVIDFSVRPPQTPATKHSPTPSSDSYPAVASPSITIKPTRYCGHCTQIVPRRFHRHFCSTYCIYINQ